ncbi:MAG: hypothetical protein ACK5YR_16460 [Pirellula sp.]|jgi:hypothetical protein
MTFNIFFERIAFGAMTAIIFYAGIQLKEMNSNVQSLNTSVAILIEKGKAIEFSHQEIKQTLKEYDSRINKIEKRNK